MSFLVLSSGHGFRLPDLFRVDFFLSYLLSGGVATLWKVNRMAQVVIQDDLLSVPVCMDGCAVRRTPYKVAHSCDVSCATFMFTLLLCLQYPWPGLTVFECLLSRPRLIVKWECSLKSRCVPATIRNLTKTLSYLRNTHTRSGNTIVQLITRLYVTCSFQLITVNTLRGTTLS